nr:hypothetical protein [Endozoicomonas sp.]
MYAVFGNTSIKSELVPTGREQETSYRLAPGNPAKKIAKPYPPDSENKTPTAATNLTTQPKPLSERITLIIDGHLMGWGKVTPVNLGKTAYRVLEECLTTAARNHGATVNHAAATITGAVGAARVRGVDPFSIANMAITSLYHAPGMASAVCGANSPGVSIAKKISDVSNIAVTLCSLYPAISSGNLTYATLMLTQLAANYGAHSQVHHYL